MALGNVAVLASAQTEFRPAWSDAQHIDLISSVVSSVFKGSGLTLDDVDFAIDRTRKHQFGQRCRSIAGSEHGSGIGNAVDLDPAKLRRVGPALGDQIGHVYIGYAMRGEIALRLDTIRRSLAKADWALVERLELRRPEILDRSHF